MCLCVQISGTAVVVSCLAVKRQQVAWCWEEVEFCWSAALFPVPLKHQLQRCEYSWWSTLLLFEKRTRKMSVFTLNFWTIWSLTLSLFCVVLQQNRLRWYRHVLRKVDDDWVKKCMAYEVEGPTPRGRPKRTWTEVVKKDCQARKLNRGCYGS